MSGDGAAAASRKRDEESPDCTGQGFLPSEDAADYIPRKGKCRRKYTARKGKGEKAG